MPMQSNDDILRRKRELRLRIGRSRRRIDGRFRATRDEARQLICWRTYVARYPLWAMAAALGAGMSASSLPRPGRVAHWLRHSLMQQAFGGFQQQIWNELRRTWTESTRNKE
ncbi:MAG: hypothetical protein WCB27_22820 [Thermoguttaceae bacterium]|jgi:hypothetical protein